MNDTQPLGTATAEPPAPETTTAGGSALPDQTARRPLRERKLSWWPMVAVAVTAVVLGALIGFGLGRATGGSNTGPGGFGGPGRGQFQGGFPGQLQPGQVQPGQQLGGPGSGARGSQPPQPSN